MVTALDVSWGAGFERVIGGGFDGTRVTPALPESAKVTLGEDTVDVLGVGIVACGFRGRSGRLSLYHCSASGFVLNFLNLAPGYP